MAEAAFASCQTIEEITLKGDFSSMKRNIFYNCSKLKNVTIGKGITSLEERIFENCSKLKTLFIPANVTRIAIGVFKNTSFSSITFERNIGWQYGQEISAKQIAMGAVVSPWETISSADLENIEFLMLINSTQTLKHNDSITEDPEVPANDLYNPDVTSIELEADELVEYIIAQTWTTKNNPLKVTLKGDSIPDLSDLKCSVVYYELILSEGVTNLGSGFSGLPNLIGITIPHTVQAISTSTFNNCTSLKSVFIPTSVTRISVSAFSNCPKVSFQFEQSDDVSNKWYINYKPNDGFKDAVNILKSGGSSYSGGTLVREGF